MRPGGDGHSHGHGHRRRGCPPRPLRRAERRAPCGDEAGPPRAGGRAEPRPRSPLRRPPPRAASATAGSTGPGASEPEAGRGRRQTRGGPAPRRLRVTRRSLGPLGRDVAGADRAAAQSTPAGSAFDAQPEVDPRVPGVTSRPGRPRPLACAPELTAGRRERGFRGPLCPFGVRVHGGVGPGWSPTLPSLLRPGRRRLLPCRRTFVCVCVSVDGDDTWWEVGRRDVGSRTRVTITGARQGLLCLPTEGRDGGKGGDPSFPETKSGENEGLGRGVSSPVSTGAVPKRGLGSWFWSHHPEFHKNGLNLNFKLKFTGLFSSPVLSPGFEGPWDLERGLDTSHPRHDHGRHVHQVYFRQRRNVVITARSFPFSGPGLPENLQSI